MSLKKGEEELNRVLLLMKYDNRMTFSENLQYVNENYFLSEQPDSKMPFQIEKFGYKQGDASTVKPALKGQEVAIKSASEIFEWLRSLNAHDWLMFVEIGASIGVVFGGPFAPIFLGIELAASAADSYLYFKEGDPYMGSMVLALNLIPGGQFVRIMKGVKWLPKKGPRYAKLLLEKAKKGKKLSKLESDELAQIAKEFTEESGLLTKVLKKTAKTKLAQSLISKTPKWLMNFIIGLSKSKAVKLSMFAAKFGGTAYTFDKLYLFVFRDSIFKDESKLDSRTKNELRFMINNLLGYEDAVNEFLAKRTADALLSIEEQSEDLLKSDVTEEMIKSDFDRMLKEFETNPPSETGTSPEQSSASTQTQTVDYNNQEIQKIVNKEINPSTKKPYVIKRGQQGDGVEQIQTMLENLKYDYLLNNYGKLESGIDSKFGPYTEEAVRKFQSDNGLKVDGVVGNETLTKLIELTKK